MARSAGDGGCDGGRGSDRRFSGGSPDAQALRDLWVRFLNEQRQRAAGSIADTMSAYLEASTYPLGLPSRSHSTARPDCGGVGLSRGDAGKRCR